MGGNNSISVDRRKYLGVGENCKQYIRANPPTIHKEGSHQTAPTFDPTFGAQQAGSVPAYQKDQGVTGGMYGGTPTPIMYGGTPRMDNPSTVGNTNLNINMAAMQSNNANNANNANINNNNPSASSSSSGKTPSTEQILDEMYRLMESKTIGKTLTSEQKDQVKKFMNYGGGVEPQAASIGATPPTIKPWGGGSSPDPLNIAALFAFVVNVEKFSVGLRTNKDYPYAAFQLEIRYANYACRLPPFTMKKTAAGGFSKGKRGR